MTAISFIALGFSLLAVVVAIWNARSDTRSAIAAEDSAVSARQAADSARESADSAARLTTAELERDHQFFAPLVTNGHFEFEERPHSPGVRYLVYKFWLAREYAMEAIVSRRANSDPTSDRHVGGPLVDGSYVVHVDAWPEGLTSQPWHDLTIRFWPPRPSERRAKPWTCRCGLSVVVGEGAGHWDFPVVIVPPTRPGFP